MSTTPYRYFGDLVSGVFVRGSQLHSRWAAESSSSTTRPDATLTRDRASDVVELP